MIYMLKPLALLISDLTDLSVKRDPRLLMAQQSYQGSDTITVASSAAVQ